MEPKADVAEIKRRILLIRGRKVMLDRDLAELYGVTTFNLNKAVTRNPGRFPDDFAFTLTRNEYRALRFQIGILEKGRQTEDEAESLRCQFGASKKGCGGRPHLPLAFSEQERRRIFEMPNWHIKERGGAF